MGLLVTVLAGSEGQALLLRCYESYSEQQPSKARAGIDMDTKGTSFSVPPAGGREGGECGSEIPESTRLDTRPGFEAQLWH